MSISAWSSPRRRQYISNTLGETSQPRKYSSAAAASGAILREQLLLALPREAIVEEFFRRGAGQGEMGDLVEGPLLDPLDAPGIDVRLAVALVDDALHAVVVVHPGHADVVAQHVVDARRRDLERFGQQAARAGLEPHEDRDAVGRLVSQGGIDALFAVHGCGLATACLG